MCFSLEGRSILTNHKDSVLPAVLSQGSVDIVVENSLKKRRSNDSVAMQLMRKRGRVVSR